MAQLEAVLEAMRDRVEAQVSGMLRARDIETITTEPDHLVGVRFVVWPESSRNANTRRASSSEADIDDTIVLEIAGRLVNVAGAGQVASLDALLAKSRNVRIALTNAAWWRSNSVECIEWVNERRQRREGWVIIRQTYTVRRPGTLG